MVISVNQLKSIAQTSLPVSSAFTCLEFRPSSLVFDYWTDLLLLGYFFFYWAVEWDW